MAARTVTTVWVAMARAEATTVAPAVMALPLQTWAHAAATVARAREASHLTAAADLDMRTAQTMAVHHNKTIDLVAATEAADAPHVAALLLEKTVTKRHSLA